MAQEKATTTRSPPTTVTMTMTTTTSPGNDPRREGADLSEFPGERLPDEFDLAEAKTAFGR